MIEEDEMRPVEKKNKEEIGGGSREKIEKNRVRNWVQVRKRERGFEWKEEEKMRTV